jgi:uncharacterized protein YxeA
MKTKLLWIVALTLIAFVGGWTYVLHSDQYHAGVVWVEGDVDVANEVGTIKNVRPDYFSQYKSSSYGDVSRAHFSVFASGTKKSERIELYLMKTDKVAWHVVQASVDGNLIKTN